MTNRTMKTLICMSPDGETVREGQFNSIPEAWDRANDMGSRWFFYPVCLVTGESRSSRARIVDAPEGLRSFIGKTVGTLSKRFTKNQQAVCDWLDGKAPLNLFPTDEN